MRDAMPRLGQGTWRMGERKAERNREIRALRAGIEAGLSLIDTAEMYAEGGAESLVGEAIAGLPRESLYLVSKVLPHNAGGNRLQKSCEGSLARLGVETLDLYLLHWPGPIPLEETVRGMERLVRQGKIRRWGVSNFDVDDMEALLAAPGGDRCAANQILYHLGSRGVEYGLLGFLKERGVRAMAYCPLAQGEVLGRELFACAAVRAVAARRGLTEAQVLLGFVLARDTVVALPKAATVRHALENARMAGVSLPPEDLALLDGAFPPPRRKLPLDVR